MLAQAVSFFKQQESLSARLGRWLLRFVGAGDEPERVVEEAFDAQCAGLIGQGNQGDIESSVIEPTQQRGGLFLTQGELQLGMVGP